MGIFTVKRIFICHSCATTDIIDFHDKIDFECPECKYPLINRGTLTKICSLYTTSMEFKSAYEIALEEIKAQIEDSEHGGIHPDDFGYFTSYGNTYEIWEKSLEEYNKNFNTSFPSVFMWLKDMREEQLLTLEEVAPHTSVTVGALSRMLNKFKIKTPSQVGKIKL
jgi:hypothetical protein